jgi:phage terminase small subunit
MKAKKPAKRVKAGTSKASAADKRTAFVEAYLSNGGNATRAAIEAGYSPATAGRAGGRMVKDVRILSVLDKRREELGERYKVTTDAVIKSISQELHFDPANLFDEDGSLKKVTDMDEDTRMALVSIETLQVGSPDAPIFIKKVKWATRQGAREQAMKHMGMFEKDNRQKSPLEDISRDLAKAVRDRLRDLSGR